MFKLSIECSKDIDELHINFSDGSSTVVEKPSNKPNNETPKRKKPLVEYAEKTDNKSEKVLANSDNGVIIDPRFNNVNVGSSNVFETPEKPIINLERDTNDVSVTDEAQGKF